jgi:ABC-type transport system substrate-binding protein
MSFSLFIAVSLLLWQPAVIVRGRGGVLRIGMTASDIPNPAGQPDQGGEGLRFVGYQMSDALVNRDLRQGDRPVELIPGLAERWEVRADDPTKWIFYLRQGVKFHDGIDLEIIPLEWNTLRTPYRKGFQNPENANIGMVNVSFGFAEPFSAFTRFFHSDFAPPKSTNLSLYVNPEVDRLIERSEVIFDPAERDRILAKVNEIVVEDAPWIFIVHDLNPRALSPKVKGFVQAQSWYQDLTLPWVEK